MTSDEQPNGHSSECDVLTPAREVAQCGGRAFLVLHHPEDARGVLRKDAEVARRVWGQTSNSAMMRPVVGPK